MFSFTLFFSKVYSRLLKGLLNCIGRIKILLESVVGEKFNLRFYWKKKTSISVIVLNYFWVMSSLLIKKKTKKLEKQIKKTFFYPYILFYGF